MMGNLYNLFLMFLTPSTSLRLSISRKHESFLAAANITAITQLPVAIESLSLPAVTKIDNGPGGGRIQAEIKRPRQNNELIPI